MAKEWFESSRPDHGFAWIVAIACFLINFIMAGLARSSGILYVSLIDLYHVSRETATTPFSIRVSVRNLTGPLVGVLGQRYGIRRITCAGGVVAGIGSILCYFAPDVFWITIFWGLIHGFGFGLSTVLHMIAINQYFDKYRATALGIGFSGDCIGTFVLPLLMDYLIAEFDVKGTFLIIGGIIFNVVPLSLLLKPPLWLKDSSKSEKTIINNELITNEKSEENQVSSEESFLNSTSESKCNLHSPHEKGLNKGNEMDNLSTITETIKSFVGTKDQINDKNYAGSDYDDGLKAGNINCVNALTKLEEDPEVDAEKDFDVDCDDITDKICVNDMGTVKMPTSITEIVMESRDLEYGNVVRTTITELTEHGNSNVLRIRTLSESRGSKPEENKTALTDDTASQMHWDAHQEVKFIKGNLEIIQSPHSSSIIISKDEKLDSNFSADDEKVQSIFFEALKTNIKPIFVLISLTMAVYCFLFIAVMTVVIDFGADKGIDPELGKYLIVAFSATDLVGRLGFGVIIDKKFIPMKYYTALTVGCMGFITAIIPLGHEYLTIFVGMSFFGLVQGGVAIMFPILITTYMTKREESVAMGCLNFYGGMLLLGMAPCIGFFRDYYGAYDNMFYLVGLATLAVGILWIFEPMLLKLQYRKKE